MICFYFIFQNCTLSSKLYFHGDQFTAVSGHVSHISMDVFVKIESVIESNENFISEQRLNLCYKRAQIKREFVKSCCLPYHRHMGYT